MLAFYNQIYFHYLKKTEVNTPAIYAIIELALDFSAKTRLDKYFLAHLGDHIRKVAQ